MPSCGDRRLETERDVDPLDVPERLNELVHRQVTRRNGQVVIFGHVSLGRCAVALRHERVKHGALRSDLERLPICLEDVGRADLETNRRIQGGQEVLPDRCASNISNET